MANNRQCPKCHVTLTRYQWSKLWWMSSIMSGRLVQPCAECGVKLRLSSMAVVSSTAALGLIGTAIAYLLHPTSILLLVALVLVVVILVATFTTRVETATLSALEPIEPKPESVRKHRL
jgi:hypothetical protein